ncbi:MAG: protein-L-isoaspartate(D-aspartate) O-methyltransferase [Alphaproteobacteria bacterium]|nr:protein-L-isoaspartate(D-aspartate) O-methyltransferase [Alphaproteobacteria bacterium]
MNAIEPRKIRLIMELRQQGIHDTRVLAAVERVPRDVFVLSTFLDQAYDNTALPIERGQTISQPYVVAFMTQALALADRSLRVLEVGTGSGYQAAVLAQLVRRVFSVERFKSLQRQAEENFRRAKVHNVVTRHGDGYEGWAHQAPFDRIMVTAAAEDVPEALKEQLADGGLLIVPVGRDGGHQRLVRIQRVGQEFVEEDLLPVRFVPMLFGLAPEGEACSGR